LIRIISEGKDLEVIEVLLLQFVQGLQKVAHIRLMLLKEDIIMNLILNLGNFFSP